MLRIHFTAEDLARTRLVSLGPLAVAQLAAPVMAIRQDGILFGRWRADARERLTPRARDIASWLFPKYDIPVDLITLGGVAADEDEAAENLLAAPRAHVCRELGLPRLRGRRLPPWLRELAAGDRDARREVVAGMRELHRAAIGDHADRMRAFVEGEQGAFGRVAATEGVGAALGRIHPMLRWRAPVLGVPAHAAQEIHLDGAGILIAPSVFCWPTPQLYTSVDQSTRVLVYPAVRDVAQAARIWAAPGRAPHAALATLLGRTRAAVLEAIVLTPATTTTLARMMDISPASASEHASALRGANLITTRRAGASVVHSATPLGAALLSGVTGGVGGG